MNNTDPGRGEASELTHLLADLDKIKRKLLRKAAAYKKRIGNDSTRTEGLHKGLWIGYEDSANELERLVG